MNRRDPCHHLVGIQLAEDAEMKKQKRPRQASLSRRPAHNMQPPTVLGIAWYRPEQWKQFRAIAADADALHDTYKQWETAATEKLRELRALGYTVQPVMIDLDELARWCRDHHLAIDGAARSQFVADKVQEANSKHQDIG
jgi:hypothetical protein